MDVGLGPRTESAACGRRGIREAHLAESCGGGREEAWMPGWGSGVGSSSGFGGAGAGREGLSWACGTGSISKGGPGGSMQQGGQETKDDMVGLHETPRARSPDSRCQRD